jgi:hypothetical protein
MNVQRAWSGERSNACTGQAADPKHGRAKSPKSLSASARAVRPASLAASARSKLFEAASGLCSEPALRRGEEGTKNSMSSQALAALCEVTVCSEQIQALRGSAKPNTRGRAGTSCCAARAGGVRLLAGSATQRTMRAGRVPQSALPNPSIERTRPGKPGRASHVKR